MTRIWIRVKAKGRPWHCRGSGLRENPPGERFEGSRASCGFRYGNLDVQAYLTPDLMQVPPPFTVEVDRQFWAYCLRCLRSEGLLQVAVDLGYTPAAGFRP